MRLEKEKEKMNNLAPEAMKGISISLVTLTCARQNREKNVHSSDVPDSSVISLLA